MQDGTTRRAFLRAVALGPGGALLYGRAHGATLTARKIVAGTFAGVWADGLRAGAIPCTQAATAGDVDLIAGTPGDGIQKIMATRGAPAIDALVATESDVFQAAALGIIEQLDPAKMPNLQGILPIFKDPVKGWGFGFARGRDGLTSNAAKVKRPPGPAGWSSATGWPKANSAGP